MSELDDMRKARDEAVSLARGLLEGYPTASPKLEARLDDLAKVGAPSQPELTDEVLHRLDDLATTSYWSSEDSSYVAEYLPILVRELRLFRAGDAHPFDRRCADALADEVDVLIKRRMIDSRSPAADALLDYRDPPRTPRSEELETLRGHFDRALIVSFNLADISQVAFDDLLKQVLMIGSPGPKHMRYNVIDRKVLGFASVETPETSQ